MFQPPGFRQQVLPTSLGVMTYYTPIAPLWRSDNDRGENLPSLLFLHSLGGGSSSYEWSKVYPAFAAHYRVVAPDLIGWGQSTHPEKDYRIADYFLMLRELIDHIGAPVTIAAASLTAGIVLRLAIQEPKLFQRLFLVSPAGYNDFGADYGQTIAARLAAVPGIDRLIYTLGAANAWAVRNFLEQFLFANPDRVTQEMVNAFLTSAQQRNADYAALASLRGDLCFDLSLYLPQLRTPTTIVWGGKSRFGDAKLGVRLANLNTAAIEMFYLIANAGVLPHLEQPEMVIPILQQTIAGR